MKLKKHSGNIETFAFFTSLPSSPNYEINAADRILNQKQHVYAKGTFSGVLVAMLIKKKTNQNEKIFTPSDNFIIDFQIRK